LHEAYRDLLLELKNNEYNMKFDQISSIHDWYRVE
jgi:hypothetical protein